MNHVPILLILIDTAGRQHQISLSAPAQTEILPDGSFRWTVPGMVGAHYQIESTTDFRAWTPLALLTNVTGTAVFTDPQAGAFRERFYRAVGQ